MRDFKGMAVFAAVAESGSLSVAGRALGMSTSAVSQRLRQLEQALGVTLLHRSTRKTRLTEAGRQIAEHCMALVAAAEAVHRHADQIADVPRGQLRLAAPQGLARHLAPALAPLLAAHPALALEVMLDHAQVDLIEARVDLALRVGRLADSTWVARRLCDIDCVVCAAPDYLRGLAPIREPADLEPAQWLGLARESATYEMALSGPEGRTCTVRVTPRVLSNSREALVQMCVAGMGVAHLACVEIGDELASGQLVALLPQWSRAPYPVWALTPRRTMPANVRLALEALRAYLLGLPGVTSV